MTTLDAPAENKADAPEHLQFNQWLEAIDTVRADGFRDYTKSHANLYGAIKKRDKETGRNAMEEAVEELKKKISYEAAWAEHPKAKADVEKALFFTYNIMDYRNPFSNAFLAWVMEDPNRLLPDYYKDTATGEFKNYDKMRGDMFEHFGQALIHGDAQQSLEDALAHKTPEGALRHATSSEFNNDEPFYLAQQSDGTWQPIAEDTIVQYLADPNGPNVFFTSNHAFHESHADLTGITDQMERLIDASVGSILNHAPTAHGKGEQWESVRSPADKKGLGKDDTIMVCMSHTRENNFLNLAQLFNRLYEVNQNVHDPVHDPLLHMAPTSALITTTILKSIVRPEDRAKIAMGKDENGTWQLFDRNADIQLADNFETALENAIFVGFSQGGNMMRDAQRLVIHELERMKTLTNDPAKLDKICHVMGSINMTVMSCNTMRMADYYRERGAYVPVFSNKHDQIALAPKHEHNFDDAVFNIDGYPDTLGHRPDTKVAALLENDDTTRYFQNVFARVSDAVGISMIDFRDGSFMLEKAPGTDTALFEARLNEALGAVQPALQLTDAGRFGLGTELPGPLGRRYYKVDFKHEADRQQFNAQQVLEAIGQAIEPNKRIPVRSADEASTGQPQEVAKTVNGPFLPYAFDFLKQRIQEAVEEGMHTDTMSLHSARHAADELLRAANAINGPEQPDKVVDANTTKHTTRETKGTGRGA